MQADDGRASGGEATRSEGDRSPHEQSGLSNSPDILDLRKLDYQVASTEYESVLREYRTQSNLLNLYLTVFTGVLVVVFSGGSESEASRFLTRLQEGPSFVLPLLLSCSAAVLFYLYSLAVDIIYNLWLVEARRSSIEEAVNRLAGQTVLPWDSRVVRFFNEEFVHLRDWVNPSWITAGWSIMILAVFSVVHIYLALALTTSLLFKSFFLVSILLALAYSVNQYYLMQTVGKKFIFESVQIEYGLLSDRVTPDRTSVWFVGFATLVLGWLTLVFQSIELGAFAVGSQVSTPLVLVFTVFVGDLVFLPVINARFADLLWNQGPGQGGRRIRPSRAEWAAIVAISLVLNTATHVLWATDQWTDFIALTPGSVSIAGAWHYAFSLMQAAIILGIAVGLLRSASEGPASLFRGYFRLWKWVVAFSLLMLANWIQQTITLFRSAGLGEVVQRGLFAAGFPLSCVAILLFAARRSRQAAYFVDGAN